MDIASNTLWNHAFLKKKSWHTDYTKHCLQRQYILETIVRNDHWTRTVSLCIQVGYSTQRLALNPTCLLLRVSFFIKIMQIWKVLKSKRHKDLFFWKYKAFKGLEMHTLPTRRQWKTVMLEVHVWVANKPLLHVKKNAPMSPKEHWQWAKNNIAGYQSRENRTYILYIRMKRIPYIYICLTEPS